MKKFLVKILSFLFLISLTAVCVSFNTNSVLASQKTILETEFFLPSSPLEFYELNSPVAISMSSDGYMIISEFYKNEEDQTKNFNRLSIFDPTTQKYVVINGKGILNGESTIFGITQIEKYGDYVFYLSGNDVYYIPTTNLHAKPQKTGVIASNFFSIKNDILIANTSNGIKSYTVDLSGETPVFTQTSIEIEVEMTSLGFLSNDKYVYYYTDPYLYRYSTQNSTSYLVAEIKNINYCVEIGEYIYYTAMGEGLSKVKKDGTEEPKLVIPADKNSNALGTFNTPQGLTVKNDNLLVCDAKLNCIQEIDTKTDDFTHFAITTESTADFRLTNNTTITSLSENYIFAVDNAIAPTENQTAMKRIVRVALDKNCPTPYKKIDLTSLYLENENFEIKLLTASDTHVLIYDGTNLTLYKQVESEIITLEPIKTIQNASVTSLAYLDGVFYYTDTANNLNYNFVNVYKWILPTDDNELTEIAEESLINGNIEIKGEAKNITVDIFGNVYILYKAENGTNNLTRLYSNTLTQPIEIPSEVITIQSDFDGNVYILSTNNNIYKYTIQNGTYTKLDYELSTYKDTIVKDMALNYTQETCYFLADASICKTADNVLDIKSLSKINADNFKANEILSNVTFVSINESAKLFKVSLSDCIEENGHYYFNNITPISNPNTSRVYAVIADLSQEYYLVSYSPKIVALVRKTSVNNSFLEKADATIIDENLYANYGITVTDDGYKNYVISNDVTTFAKPIFDENYKLSLIEKGTQVYAVKTVIFNEKSMTLIATEENGEAIGYVVSGYLCDGIISTTTQKSNTQTLLGGNAEKRILTTSMILLIALTITLSLIFIESKLLFNKD